MKEPRSEKVSVPETPCPPIPNSLLFGLNENVLLPPFVSVVKRKASASCTVPENLPEPITGTSLVPVMGDGDVLGDRVTVLVVDRDGVRSR